MKHFFVLLAITISLSACGSSSTNNDATESSGTESSGIMSLGGNSSIDIATGSSSSLGAPVSSSSKRFEWICEWNGKQTRTPEPTILVDPNLQAKWPFSRPATEVGWSSQTVANEKAILVDFKAPEIVAVSKTGEFETFLAPGTYSGYPTITDIERAASETHIVWVTEGEIFVFNLTTKTLQSIFKETEAGATLSDLHLDSQNLYYLRAINNLVEAYYKVPLAGGIPAKLFEDPYMSVWMIASDGNIYGAEGGPFSEGGIFTISTSTGDQVAQYMPDSLVYAFFGKGQYIFPQINNILYQSSITSPITLNPLYNEAISSFDNVEIEGDHFFLEENHGVSHFQASSKTCEIIGEDRIVQFKPSKGTLFAHEATNGKLYSFPY